MTSLELDTKMKEVLIKLHLVSNSRIHPVSALVCDINGDIKSIGVASVPNSILDGIYNNELDPDKYYTSNIPLEDSVGNTNPNVIHAETQAILKMSRYVSNKLDIDNLILYTSVAPCRHCAKTISYSGIKDVRYINDYKNDLGLKILNYYKVKVSKI